SSSWFVRENHVRFFHVIRVVHAFTEHCLELLKKRFIHDLSIVRLTLEAGAVPVDRQFSPRHTLWAVSRNRRCASSAVESPVYRFQKLTKRFGCCLRSRR